MHLILGVAELTLPRLLLTFCNKRARLVEDTFAHTAEFCITGRDLASVFEAIKGHFENIRIEFDLNFLTLGSGRRVSALAEVFTN